MGAIVGVSILPKRVIMFPGRNFRNANGTASGRGQSENDAELDTSGYQLTEAQKQARENHAKAIASMNVLLADKETLQNLINDINGLCDSRPTGWKQKILDKVSNANFKGTGGNIAAGILTGGIYAIVAEVKKKKEALKLCKSVKPGGDMYKSLQDLLTISIPSAQKLVSETLADINAVDQSEYQRRAQEAANKQAMDLAKTASERDKIRMENEKLEKQRQADLKALQIKEEATLAAKRDRNKTLLIVGVVGFTAVAAAFYFLKK